MNDLDLDALEAKCNSFSYWRYPGAQDDMMSLIAEVRRLRSLNQSLAMDLMASKTKVMALMGAMDIKPGKLTDKRRKENR